jgi:phage terminase small subunit
MKRENKNEYGLNQKQEIFCQEYVKSGDISKSLKIANYIHVNTGTRLLQKKEVKDRIKMLNSSIINEKIAKKEEILVRLSEILRNKKETTVNVIKTADILLKWHEESSNEEMLGIRIIKDFIGEKK